MRQFVNDYSELDLEWYNQSNYICLLSVENEKELEILLDKANTKNIRYSIFREPDLDNAVTAICLEPGQISKKLVSNLRLAFK